MKAEWSCDAGHVWFRDPNTQVVHGKCPICENPNWPAEEAAREAREAAEAKQRALEEYLQGLTGAQRARWQFLSQEKPTDIRTDLVCADCGAPLELRLGRYGRFYGCTRYEAAGCKGGVSAYDDGSPKGWPGDAETRRARKQLVDRLEETSLYITERGEEPGPMGHRFRYRTICEVAGREPAQGLKVGELGKEACERAIEALGILEKPQRTRWDHLRLETLYPED